MPVGQVSREHVLVRVDADVRVSTRRVDVRVSTVHAWGEGREVSRKHIHVRSDVRGTCLEGSLGNTFVSGVEARVSTVQTWRLSMEQSCTHGCIYT